MYRQCMYLLLLQYHTPQQLILQALHRHCEINDGRSGTYLHGNWYKEAENGFHTRNCSTTSKELVVEQQNGAVAYPHGFTHLRGVSRVR